MCVKQGLKIHFQQNKNLKHKVVNIWKKINSIQIIKWINKRIDNTLETGTSTTDAISKTDNKTKNNSVNAGLEVSAGWGHISGSVSTSAENEGIDTSQRENS